MVRMEDGTALIAAIAFALAFLLRRRWFTRVG
jgi:MYXO-CTERM domain-containing protein